MKKRILLFCILTLFNVNAFGAVVLSRTARQLAPSLARSLSSVFNSPVVQEYISKYSAPTVAPELYQLIWENVRKKLGLPKEESFPVRFLSEQHPLVAAQLLQHIGLKETFVLNVDYVVLKLLLFHEGFHVKQGFVSGVHSVLTERIEKCQSVEQVESAVSDVFFSHHYFTPPIDSVTYSNNNNYEMEAEVESLKLCGCYKCLEHKIKLFEAGVISLEVNSHSSTSVSYPTIGDYYSVLDELRIEKNVCDFHRLTHGNFDSLVFDILHYSDEERNGTISEEEFAAKCDEIGQKTRDLHEVVIALSLAGKL